MRQKRCLWFFLISFVTNALADNIDTAITFYENRIAQTTKKMSWFIPFHSFTYLYPKNSICYCCDSDEDNDDVYRQTIFSPTFFVVVPIIQASIEIAATPTIRFCALPYLGYLAYLNSKDKIVVDFLKEIKTYNNYLRENDSSAQDNFYDQSMHLKEAYTKLQNGADRKMSLDNFIYAVRIIIAHEEYRYNNVLWSLKDFIVAIKDLGHDVDSTVIEDYSEQIDLKTKS